MNSYQEMIKDIEFVCSGNTGRSPLAEAIAKKELEDLGIYEIAVSSSGTLVDYLNELKKKEEPVIIEALSPSIEEAIGKGIVSKEDIESEGVKSIIIKFEERENQYREEILKEKGLIKYFHNLQPKQTVVRPDSELILTLSGDNLERVSKIYHKAKSKPKVELLAEIPDTILSLNYEEYKLAAEKIETAVLKRIRSLEQ